MDQNAYETLTAQIFELFETGEEAISFLNGQGLKENQYLLEDLQALCTAISSAVEQLAPQIKLKNKLKEIGLNAPLTVERISKMLAEGQTEAAHVQYTCSFVPLFLFWRQYTEFFLIHAADDETLSLWYQEETKQIRQIRNMPKLDEEREYRFDFSIVVLFYGNQKMTKECLDAIETYTKGHSYELITFDNGSDPDTTAWCESLPHVKKIYYPHNMGSSVGGNLIFTMAPYYMEGKYLLFVSNDVVVTPRYDDILYQCIESDPNIALAVPVCNSASNLQAISVPYQKNNIKAMIAFADQYNHADPLKWMDRARLFQILGCYRPQVLQQMGLAFDPLFCYDMFADDDHSCRIRRMGYRQVLCKDVFVHHYGSATIKEDQFDVMDLGRAQFYKKYGVDAWYSLGTELNAMLETFSIAPQEHIRVLALNPLFGESVLALVNQLKVCGCTSVTVDALTEAPRYLDDMNGLFHYAGLLQKEETALSEEYDVALVGTGLERCHDLRAVIHAASKRLKQGGLLITQYKNQFNLPTVINTLQGKAPVHDVFSHDPNENPVLQLITEDALELLMRQERIIRYRSVRLTNQNWERPANQILAAFKLQNQVKNDQLVTTDIFNLWIKQA